MMNDREGLESDESYCARILEQAENDPRKKAFKPQVIKTLRGGDLDAVGEYYHVTRRLIPVDLRNAIADDGSTSPEMLALTLLSSSTTETANIMRELSDSDRRRIDALKIELDEARADLAAVAEVHRLLGIPKYARRLLRLLHADFESS